MTLEKGAPFFDDEILQKTLIVSRTPYKDKFVPCINIKGNYLSVYGFNTGDKLFVQVTENTILIDKIIDSKNDLTS